MCRIKIACAAIWVAEGVYRQLQFLLQYFPACGDLVLGDIVWYSRKNVLCASMPANCNQWVSSLLAAAQRGRAYSTEPDCRSCSDEIFSLLLQLLPEPCSYVPWNVEAGK